MLIMGFCWQGFPPNAGKPAGNDEEVTRISNGEQSWEIAIKSCSKGVFSSKLIWEYLVLSETNSLMKGDNIASKPLDQEVGQMANLKASKKQLRSRKVGFTAHSKAWESEKIWCRKRWLSYCVKNIRISKMMMKELQYKQEWDSSLTSGARFIHLNEVPDSTDLNKSPWAPSIVSMSLVSRVNTV